MLVAQPSDNKAAKDEASHVRPSPASAALKGPVTAVAALNAVRSLGKTKENKRVEQCTGIVLRALLHGNTEARAMSCNDNAARTILQLVEGRLPVFEYTELYNASRTMSVRDVEHAKVLDLRLRFNGVLILVRGLQDQATFTALKRRR